MNTINPAAAPDGAAVAPDGAKAESAADTVTAGSKATTDKVDRDIPKLKSKRKTKTPMRLALLGVAIMTILALGAGLGTFMKRLKERKAEEVAARTSAKPDASTGPTKIDFAEAKKRIMLEEATAAAQGDSPERDSNGLPVPASARWNFADAKNSGGAGSGRTGSPTGGSGNGGAGQAKTTSPRPETKEQRLLSSDFIVGEGSAGATVSATTAPTSVSQPQYPGAGSHRSALEEDLTPSKITAVAAGRRRHLNMLMPAGTIIPCGQYTYIASDNPGQALCVVSQDIYSADGSTLLIERGSKVLGERDQPLRLGQSMMPVLWTRIDTPNGVTVDINSLATDSLGASGLPVNVDTHFRERFGAAILLSLISDVGEAAANAANNGGNTIRLTTTQSAGQELASKALEKTINIPPTGYSVQGSAINIFVARDVDFGRIYDLVRY